MVAALGLVPGLSVGAAAGDVAVLPVRAGVYMLTVAGVNVTVQTGPDGAVVVDPGPQQSAAEVQAAIRKLTGEPVRYVINTSADPQLTGANELVSRAGQSFIANQLGGAANVVATQNTLLTMISQPGDHSEWALPSEVFNRPQLSLYINRQPVAVVWLPAAHSNGDVAVRFDSSDVLVTGDIFDDTHFPVIDLQHGGSIQGEVDALNRLLNTLAYASVPLVGQAAMLNQPLGTLVIPSHGPLCDQHDLVTYRDMVETIRERVADLIAHGADLSKVLAARPAQGFVSRFGSDSGAWTTQDFITAVYRSLQAGQYGGSSSRRRTRS
jgi:glyoxylase-like metal-dependent hydrolase (beta-lactamase superfamily II)